VDVVDQDKKQATAVQAHRSFRVCVGQSVGEMVMELMLQVPFPFPLSRSNSAAVATILITTIIVATILTTAAAATLITISAIHHRDAYHHSHYPYLCKCYYAALYTIGLLHDWSIALVCTFFCQ
jgi:hypothetical protein